jgi:EmrB/QacA subfamily drug resistance transporter
VDVGAAPNSSQRAHRLGAAGAGEHAAVTRTHAASTAPTGNDEPDPRRWRALAVLLIAGFMGLLDVSIVNVALPSIRDSLGASESDLQWILSGYAVAFGLVLVSAGRLGDVRGRRNVFVIGLVLFSLSSAACGFAPEAVWLSAARLVQGVAAGLITPQTAGFIQELFRGAERGKAFGLLGATIGISTAVGPLLGGVLIALGGADWGWRLVFFVNLPVGIVALVLAFRFLPAAAARRRRESLDPVGIALLGIGVVLVLLPLVEERNWPGAEKWLLVPAGLVVLGCFAGWERAYARRGRAPMVDVGLLRTRSFSVGSTVALLYFAGFTAIFFVLTLFFQTGRGYSPLQAGLAITPFALGSAVSSALGGRVVVRLGRPLVAAGLLMVAAGLAATDVAVGLSDGADVGWLTAVPLLIAGVGSGLVISPNQTLTLSQVPIRYAGSAAGVLQTGQRIGSAVGIAAVGAMVFSRLDDSGDWAGAVSAGLWLCVGIVVLALVLAVIDSVRPPAPAPAER